MKNKGKILVKLGLAVIVIIAGCMALVLPNGFSKSQNPSRAAFTSGDGKSPETAYKISDLATLNGTGTTNFRGHVASNVNSTSKIYYELTNHIDLSSISNWTPIPQFGVNMVLDGKGFEIRNLKNTGTGTAQGFIANLQGTVQNVTFTNVSMTGSGNLRGVVAATVDRTAGSVSALISNVHVTGGTVTGVRAGGLVGGVGVTTANGNGNQNDASTVKLTIKDSSNAASVGIAVTATDNTAANSGVGGLVGYVRKADLEISGSSNTGTITLRSSGKHVGLGGLVGMVNDAAPTSREYASVIKINSSFNDGIVSFTRNSIAMIDSSTSSNNAGTLNNWQATGGLIGLLFSSSSASNNDSITSTAAYRIQLEISGCYNKNLVQCYSYATSDIRATAGGFIGLTGGVGESKTTPAIIKNSYNTGSIRAISWLAVNNQGSTSNAGGMLGFLDTSAFKLSHCYNTGAMYSHARVNNSSNNSVARANCGGIVGDQNDASILTIENCASNGSLWSSYSPTNANVGTTTFGIGPITNTEHIGNVSTSGTGPGSGTDSTIVDNKIAEIVDIYKTETVGAVYVKLNSDVQNFTFTPSGHALTESKGYKLYKGETFTFTVTPANGFVITYVKIDGADKGAPNGIATTNTYQITTSDMEKEQVKNVEIKVAAEEFNYTVVPNNGEQSTSVKVNAGDNITAPAGYLKTGYNIVGWYEDNNDWKIPFDFNIYKTMPARDVTIYAKWEPISNIVVTFNKNDITGTANAINPSQPNKTVTYDAAYGALATISRDGYTFGGWWTKNGTGDDWGTQVTPTTVVKTVGEHDLYAKWTANTVTVTFNTNKGSGSTTPTTPSPTTRNVTFDGTYGALATISRVGYDFKGWSLSSNGNTITSDTKVTNSASHSLYAIWTPKNITLSFDSKQGTYITGGAPYVVKFDAPYENTYGSLPEVERTGYTFNGWFTTESGGTKITSGSTVTTYSGTIEPYTLKLFAQWTANKFTVTFNTNKGDGSTTPSTPVPTTKEVTFDGTYGTLPTSTRVGYEFDGWYTSTSSNIEIESTTTVETATNHTLYARWTAVNVAVSFAANGGTYVSPSNGNPVLLAFDSTYGTLPTVTHTGYTFNGWFTSAIGGTKVDSATPVRNFAAHMLYAQWTAVTVTVTFDGNGATNSPSFASKPIIYDSEYGALATISRYGYTFGGWWTKNGTGDDWGTEVTSTTVVNNDGNHTLYAKWAANEITVTFDVNKGAGSSTPKNLSKSSMTVTFDEDYGTLATIERDGYNFAGWYTQASGGIEIKSDSDVSNSVDHTLYAHWTAELIQISFDVNGGTGTADSRDVVFDSAYGTLPTVTLVNNNFGGWWTSKGSGETGWGSQVLSTTKVENPENHTLYVRWYLDNQYTITFNTNGGTAIPSITNFKDEPVAPGTTTKYGYSFVGWYFDNGTWLQAFDNKMPGENTDLYAKWNAISGIVVTFDVNKGTGTSDPTTPSPASISVTYDGKYGTLPIITRDGYSWLGWFTAAIGGNEVTANTTVTKEETHTLYAQWTARTDILVTFNGNGTANYPSFASKDVTFDGTYGALAEITRVGYTFAGWYTEENGGSKVESTTPVRNSAAHTLYAKWTANDVSVSFDVNDTVGSTRIKETAPISKTLKFDGTYDYDNLPNITRDGYTLLGWSLVRDGALITSITKVTNAAAHTLYAKWTANDVTVSFDANDTVGSTRIKETVPTNKTLKFDGTYGTLPTISRNGYSFGGWWTKDGTDADWGTQITSDLNVVVTAATLNLYAKWTANTITVAFDLNKGTGSSTPEISVEASINVTFDGTYAGLPTEAVVTRGGYNFAGWSLSRDGNVITAATKVEDYAAHKLYAKWTAKIVTVNFNGNKGNGTTDPSAPSISSKNVTFDGTYGSLATITRNGYTFSGWWTNDGTGDDWGTQITSDLNVVVTAATLNLYAKWTANTITVTFDVNKGTGTSTPTTPNPTSINVTFDGTYDFDNLPVITRNGYTFEGWSLTRNGDLITPTTNVKDYTAHNLYAIWTAKTGIVVNFDANTTVGSTNINGSVPPSITVTFDKTYDFYGLPTNIERNGYTFIGWSLVRDGALIDEFTQITNSANHTLYAKWTANTVKITFDVNESAGSSTITGPGVDFVNVIFDGTYVGLPTISRKGYTFNGWSLTNGGALITPTTNVTDFETHELHAIWTAISYTITFNTNGGSAVAPVIGNYDTDISKPSENPTRIGYTFKWWYIGDSENEDTELFPHTIKGDTTIYAKWEIKQNFTYDIIIEARDSTSGDPIKDGSQVPIIFNGKQDFKIEDDGTQFILWNFKQLANYSFDGYAILSTNSLYTYMAGVFGQLSDGFLWINMSNIPDELLHAGRDTDNRTIKIYAYYNKEYTIKLEYGDLVDNVEVYVSYWNGQEYKPYNDPKAINRFAEGSNDLKISVSQSGNYVIEFYYDSAKQQRVNDFNIDSDGGYLFSLFKSVTFWIDVKLSAVTLVQETLTKTQNGDIRGERVGKGNYQIDNATPATVNLSPVSGNGGDFVTWYLNFNGELIDINDARINSYFVLGANNVIEKISFADLRAFKNRLNEIVLLALFSEKIQLNISVSDNAPTGHNKYEIRELIGNVWESKGTFSSTEEALLAYGTKYRIYPVASKFYTFEKFDGAELALGDIETSTYLEITMTSDRNITLKFLSKEFTMFVTKTSSGAKGTWSYEDELKFTVGDTITIAFDVASFYTLNSMTIGSKSADSFAAYGMVYRNGTLTIDVTVDWLIKADAEGWLDIPSNSAACKFYANIGADTPISPLVIAGGSIAGAIAIAIAVMITISVISIRRKKQDYAAALVKHREGMARLNQNIVSDLVKD